MTIDRRGPRRTRLWTLVAAAMVALLWLSFVAWQAWHHRADLQRRLTSLQGLAKAQLVDCASFVQAQPLVLLILGQSNAANHGPHINGPTTPSVRLAHDGQCAWAREPLPGGTGSGASLWARLPSAMSDAGQQRPVVMALLAVDASTAADWTAKGSPLRSALQHLLAGLSTSGLQPDFVLWQQGESDASLATPATRYVKQLQSLADILGQAGIDAPILLARSTLCRSAPAEPLRQAIDDLMRTDERFVAGPDTDALDADWARRDGCHFSIAGLNAAARLWAQALTQQPAAIRQLPKANPETPSPV